MAENAATLDFKTLEEVLTVIRSLTSILSVTGIHITEVFSPNPMDQLNAPIESEVHISCFIISNYYNLFCRELLCRLARHHHHHQSVYQKMVR
jgi:hypothetical protein